MACLGGGLVALGAAAALRWPSGNALSCSGASIGWHQTAAGRIADCSGRGGPAPAGGARLLGLKVDLNDVPELELARIEGVGPALARALVAGRRARNGFRTWDEVAGVPGVGPVKLAALRGWAVVEFPEQARAR